MRRAFRIALLLSVLTSGFAPAAGRAAAESCSLSDDRPAYVCGGAMSFKTAITQLSGRGMQMLIMGFEGTGVTAPEAKTRSAGACVLIWSRTASAEMCGLPFEVTFDPLLETATIKGSTKNKSFGAIAVDLTLAATSDLGADPGLWSGIGAGCGRAGTETGEGNLARTASGAGTIRVGRTTLKPSAAPAGLWQGVSQGGSTALSIPCAKERESIRVPWMLFECLGYFHDEYGAGLCRSTNHVRAASVKAKSKTVAVEIIATDLTAATPTVPDPTWYIPPDGDPSWLEPADFGYWSSSGVCLIIKGRGFVFGSCEGGYLGDFEIDIDPALRTAHLKGEIASPFEQFYGYRPSGIPSAMDFGRAYIDLTLTPEGGNPTPVGRTSSTTFGSLCGAGTMQQETLLQGDGGAEGYVVFKRRHGSFRGNASKPLASTMESLATSLNFVNLSTPACSQYSEPEPA